MTSTSRPVHPAADSPDPVPVSRSSADYVRFAFEQAPVAACLLGLDVTILEVNQAFCRLTGSSPAHLVQRSIVEVLGLDDRAAEQLALRLRDGAAEDVALEHRFLDPDGTAVQAMLRLRLLRGADGKPLAYLAFADDVTAQRTLQDSLRQANANLSRRVDDLSLLNRIARLLSRVTDLHATLELVCRLLRDALGAADVLVALRERPGSPLAVVAHAGNGPAILDPAAGDAEQAGTVFLTRGAGATHTGMVVALRAQEGTTGFLQIRVDGARLSFTPAAVSLAQTIGGAIAGAAANAQLYARAVRSSQRLEHLNAASRMINGAGLDLPALYAAIHRAVATLMPVEAFVLTLVEPGSDHVVDVYQADRGGVWPASTGPLATSFAAYMQTHASSLLVDDFALFDPDTVQFDVFGDGEDTRSGVAASFVTADGLYGLLFAQCYPPGVYSGDDLTSLELLAAHASTAIENARRAQRARRDAVDEERTRLARDLHDSVSQRLFSASLIAERLPAMARLDQVAANDGLDLLHQQVRGALAEMRALLIELRPAALADAPLHSALALLTQAYGGRRGIPFALALDPVPQLPQPVAVALYRIVQECLNNIIKHAQARSACVSLAVDPPAEPPGHAWSGTLTIQVRDDGRGFAVESVDRGRLGVGIMRERAASIGARLELHSQPGQGTQVEVVWRGDATREP